MKSCHELSIQQPDPLKRVAENSRVPVVIRGAVSHWPVTRAALASDLQLQQYLLEFDRAQPLLTYELPASEQGRVFYQPDLKGLNFKREMRCLKQVFESLNRLARTPTGEGIYMGSTNLERHLPGLRHQNPLEFGVPQQDCVANIWLGNQTTVAVHYDFPHNFACCVAGQRTFTLFPPDQLENLYPGPLDPTPGGPAISLVNTSEPDFARYPRFAIALENALQVTLSPGDVLFIPSMWWHEVKALHAFNVLVNYWWKTTPAYSPSPMVALQAALLSMKDLSGEQKAAWKGLFDYYVFNEEHFDHIPPSAKGVLGELNEHLAMQLRAKLLNALNR